MRKVICLHPDPTPSRRREYFEDDGFFSPLAGRVKLAEALVEERRKLERFDLALPATIETLNSAGADGKGVPHFVTGNICSGGAYFPTTQALAEGDEVGIRILLVIDKLRKLGGRDAVIHVKGKVLRADRAGMAIRFSSGYKIVPNRSWKLEPNLSREAEKRTGK